MVLQKETLEKPFGKCMERQKIELELQSFEEEYEVLAYVLIHVVMAFETG